MDNSVASRRQEAGLSQGELAARTGVSRQTINAIERGSYEPRLALAFRLADIFECRVDVLFRPSSASSVD
ncbi:helix-turn-helix transcriptional regulator [Cellulomonas sp. P22]|uniref:helix-turn-helix transcriptional regulator n=1 Tax=Cellulomonas sp. P22 TaxID=3373189 RepID=UPI0037B4EDCC